jgi:long-chain acyl-CoA synthetase
VVRSQIRADLRAGGMPHGNLGPQPGGGRGSCTPSLGGASGFCRARAVAGGDRHLGRGGRGRCPPGEIGEIMVRGAPVMPGYWKNAEGTAKTIVERLADDRRCRAAGRGRLPDAGGPVEGRDHLGRDEHLPARGGGGAADPSGCARGLGHRACVRRMGRGCRGLCRGRTRPREVDPAALDAHCLDQMARFKRPKDYVAVPELPKNNYGKVLKTALRARLEADGT